MPRFVHPSCLYLVASSVWSFQSFWAMQGSYAEVVDASLLTDLDRASLLSSGQWIVRRPHALPLFLLGPCVAAVFGWKSSDDDAEAAELRAAAEWRGAAPWLCVGRPECASGLAASMGLIDSFALLHGDAVNRFTCWDQVGVERFPPCIFV